MKIVYLLWKNNRGFHMLHICLATIFCFLLILMAMNIFQSQVELKATASFKGKNLYQLADSLYNEKEQQFFQKKDSYDILKGFGDYLEQEDRFQYAVVNWQPTQVMDFKGNEVFAAYYELGEQVKTQNFSKSTYSEVKALQMNQGAFEVFQVRLSSGDSFQASDYIYTSSKDQIPLILGAALEPYYNLGDTLSLRLYNKAITGKVIGFAAPSQTVITARSYDTLLDRYIIMPALTFNEITPSLLQGQNDSPFLRASLYSRINGFMFTSAEPQEMRNIMSEISEKTNFYDYSIIGADGGILGMLIQVTDQNRDLLYWTVAIALVVILSLYLWTLSMHIRNNQKTYAVLLISGYRMQHIPRLIAIQTAISIFLGSVLPVLLFSLFWEEAWVLLLSYIMLVLLVTVLLTGIIYFSSRRTLDRTDIIQQLKG